MRFLEVRKRAGKGPHALAQGQEATLEHEAANDSDELRVVLILDLWNPLLSVADRELAKALAIATRGFEGAPAG